jgi:hypothetical protein
MLDEQEELAPREAIITRSSAAQHAPAADAQQTARG